MGNLTSRFWAKVAIGEPDECWLWQGAISDTGYGHIRDGLRTVGAHRTAWELANGPIPNGLDVLHRCDVRACVNPAHLFLGTQADNMQDMVSKDRAGHRGLNRRRLTAPEVEHIRELCSTGVAQRSVAAQFGICQPHVSRIVTGDRETWSRINE